MAIDWTTAAWFLPFIVPITIWVTWSDMASMKIPNKAVLSLLAVFVVVGLVALPFQEYLWRYAHFGVVIVTTFILSSIGTMGAGDAKYIAAMAPFIDRADFMPFMILLCAVTIAAFLLHRIAKRSFGPRMFPDWESWTPKRRREFPMGMALAPALMFYMIIGIVI